MMTGNFISHIHRQADQMLQLQTKIASQKRVNKPSDDPAATARIMNYRSMLERIDQYDSHIERGKTRLEFMELTLGQASDLVRRAQQIAEQNKGSNVTAGERLTAAAEVKNLYDQLMQLANTTYNNNTVFSGHQTDQAPFTRDAGYNITYNGDAGNHRIVIGENVEVAIDSDGRNYFQAAGSGGINIFDQLKGLIDGLENPSLTLGSAQIDATIDPLFDGRAQVNTKRAELGPKLYQLDASQQHWLSFSNKITDTLAGEENADTTEAALLLRNLEISYESTLATAARIIQPGLLKFLG